MRHSAVLLFGVALIAFQSGCGSESERGVAPEWTLSVEPSLSIGEDGTPAGEFVRVSTAVPLLGSEIAVVDVGAKEIRVFSGDGVHLRTLGRSGEGPGEFAGISWVQLSNDTLVVYDLGQRRITLLGLDGAALATIRPQPEGSQGFGMPRARAPSGDWVIAVNIALASAPQGAGLPSGLMRDSLGIGLLPASGAGPISFFSRLVTQPILGIPEIGIGMMAPLFAAPQIVLVGENIAVLDPENGTLSWYNTVGELETTAALGVPRRAMTGAWLDSTRDARLAEGVDQRQRTITEAIFATSAAPAEFPVFRSALADGADQLWLEEWQHPLPTAGRYLVIGPDGSWRASVQMPERFTPTAIGTDWVLGIHRDEDGLQRVMRYGLDRR